MGKNIVSAVWELALPQATALGLSLWDVRFEKEGANYYLKVIIDKEGGVSIDDCVNMSHALDPLLDDADPIECPYNLQVSSPGLERRLTRETHFAWAEGKNVILRLIRPLADGNREFHGVLVGLEGKNVTIRPEGDAEMTASLDEIAFVKLDDADF